MGLVSNPIPQNDKDTSVFLLYLGPKLGGSLAGQKSAKLDIGTQYFLNYSPKLEKIDPIPPKPQNIDI